MLRRLHATQPEGFAFTAANQVWAEAQMSKYPEGRQASAIIPLLWRAQEQEGWLTRPAIETVAGMLDMAYIRALEVASFYFMFQLQPVGSVAHVQICGTTPCMLCGAENLVAVCREKIADKPHVLSTDGKFSWEEVECLGACTNAPMAQIGKDYYEDLTAERFAQILDEMAAGQVPTPGPQNGRFASEPKSGLTTLKDFESGRAKYNASAQRASDLGDTIKRINGTEVPLVAPWRDKGANHAPAPSTVQLNSEPVAVITKTATKAEEDKAEAVKPETSGQTPSKAEAPLATAPAGKAKRPEALSAARAGGPDNLKLIKGVGPKLEKLLHRLGFFHFDQVANWSAEEVAWVDENLEGFKGRVTRDDWVAQARILSDGGQTAFSAKSGTGSVKP